MSFVKNLFSFYISSSIHVALAVTSLSAITFLHLEAPVSENLLLFIFFGTVTGYNFIKFAGIAKLHHRSLTANLKTIQLFSFLVFVGLVYLAFRIKLEVLLIAGLFGFLTLFYALPFFGERNLRTIGGIKIYIIAVIWAGVSVICPTRSAGFSINTDIILEFIQRVLVVLVLLIPFEIRDLKYDKAALKTLPQSIGVKGAKVTGIFFAIGILGLELMKSIQTTASLVALIIAMGVAVWFILKSEEEQGRFFSSFWVEGIPLMWLAVLLLLRTFL